MVTPVAGKEDAPEATQLWGSAQACSGKYEKPCCCKKLSLADARDMGTGWAQET